MSLYVCVPQGVFCEQEMVRFNHLLNVMSKSLSQLKKAIKGLVVMSSQLEEMHQCFLFQKVPPSWEAVAYPSLKPLGSWVEDLYLRLATLHKWITTGSPSCFWISGFFFPQVLLACLLACLLWLHGCRSCLLH